MAGRKRAVNDWYSPYFTPTTIIVAAVVLFISVQVGLYAGNLVVARGRAQYSPAVVVPVAHQAPRGAAHPASPAHANSSPLAKTPR